MIFYSGDEDGKFKITKSGGSTTNLLKHLKNHLDKIDPSVKKQAEFMKKFVNNKASTKIVSLL